MLEQVLKKSWSKETAYSPHSWCEENPAFGQCAVTALIINDYFGGDIVWTEATLPSGEKISHYFNIIEETEVDLTRSQFTKDTIFSPATEKKKGFASTRDFMLSNEHTKERYTLLKTTIQRFL